MAKVEGSDRRINGRIFVFRFSGRKYRPRT
jgi:hypothetical protein